MAEEAKEKMTMMRYIPLLLIPLLMGCVTRKYDNQMPEAQSVPKAVESDTQATTSPMHALSEPVQLKVVEREDAIIPSALNAMPSTPGAVGVTRTERAQMHDGQVVIDPQSGKPIMEREFRIVKSNTQATVTGAKKVRVALMGPLLTDTGEPVVAPSGRAAIAMLPTYADATGDTVTVGRDPSLLKAQGEARTNQLKAAVDYLKASYAGRLKIVEARGQFWVSLIDGARETALGVLERVTPIGAAIGAAERGVALLVRDEKGSRTITVDRPEAKPKEAAENKYGELLPDPVSP